MKLPVVNDGGKLPPSAAQTELAVVPVARAGASQPEFPRRSDLARKGASVLVGGAILAAGALAHGKSETQVAVAKAPPAGKGSIDGQPVPKKTPKIVIYRSSGIGPSEEFDEHEVNAFLSWKFAHDGKLDIKSDYALQYDEVKINIDGYDPQRNIGYEFIHGNDYDEFTDAVRAKVNDWMTQKKAAILVIDMDGTPDAPTLSKKVTKFLAQVKKNPPAAGLLMTVQPVAPVPSGNPCDGEVAPPPAKTAPPAVKAPTPVMKAPAKAPTPAPVKK